MPSKLRQLKIPLTEQQQAALESLAGNLNTTKTRLIIEALQAQHAEFAAAEDVQPRGKYERKKAEK